MAKHYITSYKELNKAFYDKNLTVWVDGQGPFGQSTAHVTSLNYKDAKALGEYYCNYTPDEWNELLKEKGRTPDEVPYISPEMFKNFQGVVLSMNIGQLDQNVTEFSSIEGDAYVEEF